MCYKPLMRCGFLLISETQKMYNVRLKNQRVVETMITISIGSIKFSAKLRMYTSKINGQK